MRKKFKNVIALLLVVIIGCAFFAGCEFFAMGEYDPDDGYDDPDDYVEPDYVFTVACAEETTTITLSNVGQHGDTAQLVYLKPYQYLYSEGDTGIATETDATATVVADYECGSEAVIEIERYNEEGYDTVYCKFYVVKGRGDIVAGPIYATDIEPIYTHDEVVKVDSIKGVTSDDRYASEIADLGCQNTAINYVVTYMVLPNEIVDENTGEITQTIEYEEFLDENGIGYVRGPQGNIRVQRMIHNGTKYYFRLDQFEYNERTISAYTRDNVKVTLIVLLGCDRNQLAQPYFLTYPAARPLAGRNWFAVNTSNEYGANYWAALMEFIARRYSCEDTIENAVHGTVESYVMCNEIDYPNEWNVIVDRNEQLFELEDYAAEYERMMRITNQSFKKVYSRNVPLISFTHNWGSCPDPDTTYAPKDIFDYISAKTLREGNYNWGIAAHPYGSNLSVSSFWRGDINDGTVTGALNTPKITWTNLEVLQLYLEQRIKLCNGEVRGVYLTEGGVSSGTSNHTMTDETKNNQAAGIVYAWYKASQLSCIKAFVYYRLQDNPGETVQSLYFGLLTEGTADNPWGTPKPAYYAFKYVDTQWTWAISDHFFPFIEWTRWENGTNVPYGNGKGGIYEFKDTMKILPSLFDWETRWDPSKVELRHTNDPKPTF